MKPYHQLPKKLIVDGETSRFVNATMLLGQLSGGAMLFSYIAGLAVEPLKGIADKIMGLSAIVFTICICVLGIRHVNRTSNQTVKTILAKVALYYFVIPIILTIVIVAIAYFLNAPGINPNQ